MDQFIHLEDVEDPQALQALAVAGLVYFVWEWIRRRRNPPTLGK
jgi:hypothetical protein